MTTTPTPGGASSGAGAPDRAAAFRGRFTMSRPVGVALFVVLLGAAAWVSRVATRPRSAPPAVSGHVHGAAPSGGDTSQAVTIAGSEARRIGVTYAPVAPIPVSREVRVVGQIVDDETAVHAVSPKIEGWVDQLYVDYTGQAVRRGQPLLTIYSPALVSAQQELLLALALRQRVDSGTADARQQADALVDAARRRLAYWDIPNAEIERLERTRTVTKTMTLRAPASGVVLEKDIVAGQSVMPGQTIYRIADLSTVWLEGEVFEQDLPDVHLGMVVTAELRALPGERRTGRITYVYPTLDPDTRTERIRVALPNPGLALKPGMYATIRFTAPGRRGVLSVPRTAVLSTGERSIVFVKQPDGRLQPHYVTLGMANDDRVEILSGLAPGDTVVASATFLVDAESNLGTLMGGMGDMPGMDMTKPVDERSSTAKSTTAAPER